MVASEGTLSFWYLEPFVVKGKVLLGKKGSHPSDGDIWGEILKKVGT